MLMRYDDKSFFNSGAIYGTIKILLLLFKQLQPQNIILVYEGDKNNNPRFKHPDYKKKRANDKSIDITNELKLMQHMAAMMGMINIIPQRGEADDGIANVATKLNNSEKFDSIYIISNDKDMMALLKQNIKIIKKIQNNIDITNILTKTKFVKEWGFLPRYFSYFLAIAGDTSDCIPGIYRIGKITAKKILQKLTQQKIDINPHNIAIEIKEKLKKKTLLNLNSIEEQLISFYNLTKIRHNWHITIAIGEKPPNIKRIEKLFTIMQFQQLLKNFSDISTMCDNCETNKLQIVKLLQS
jgi:DNA polymerase-1